MNIDKLYEGQVIKNYKELCELLNVSSMNGSGKLAKLKKLKLYCNYHNEGHKFVIDEIFKIPILDPNNIENRIGKTNYNNNGSKMTIVEYYNSNNIIVQFENGFKTKCTYGQFKSGYIKSPYDKTVYGVGYLGEYNKEYNPLSSNVYYKKWHGMLQRCYSEAYQKGMQTYIGCSVIEEWHSFDNFTKWMTNNYYTIDNELMCLDKDILNKGNRVYSPNSCIFVPERINLLFVKCNNARGNTPIGVHYDKKNKKYSSSCHNYENGKNTYLGWFDNQKDAFDAYKKYKEKYIKEVAEEYKDKIPNELYTAMINWKVEITD